MAVFVISLGRTRLRKHFCDYCGLILRTMSSAATTQNERRGVVLGVYEAGTDGDIGLTAAATGFQDTTSGRLLELIKVSGLMEKKGKGRVFYGLDANYGAVSVVSLGKRGLGFDETEQLDERKENIRSAIAGGVTTLQDAGVSVVEVDPCGDPETAAEGAVLAAYSYDELKAADSQRTRVSLSCYSQHAADPESVQLSWKRGVVLAEGQNFARRLMETPANLMTPTKFADEAQSKLGPLENVVVLVRDKAWAESEKMGAFLSVASGSDEPLKFVEVIYSGGEPAAPPIVIVGKGITFDSGGISIKPSAKMDRMRADMGGAACALASVYSAARLRIPINVVVLIPLSENMPDGRATKPGDVVTARNGKTIQVDNTDAEGRLILCDALNYAETFKPRSILDMATLTGAMVVALGSAVTGVFTNSNLLWQTMQQAGALSGDRVWRMPLFKQYTKMMTEQTVADINNISPNGSAGACTAAAFLQEFVTHDQWMHLDIAGVMSTAGEIPYLRKGMAGRPTRTVVGFLQAMSRLT